MADIRISNLTTASTSASDDYIGIDGSTNGTRKLSAYNPSFGGTGTFGGTVTINSNASYIGKSGSGNGGNWRFVSDDGTTRWLAGLLGSGGETTFSIYDLVNSRQTLALTAAGNAALTGNLTVSGTGQSSFGGTNQISNVLSVGATNVANSQALYLSISQRANYGYALLGYNLTGTDGTDAYTSPKTGTGTFGLELQNSGIARFVYSTAATTAGSTVSVTEAARFVSGNFLIGTTVNSGAKLQVGTNTTTSAGGMVFGTDTNLYRVGAGVLRVNSSFIVGAATLNANEVFAAYSNGYSVSFAGDSTNKAVLTLTGGPGDTNKINSSSASNLAFQTNSTTALTLDSSQRTILAGALRLNNAYVSGAPTATGYVTLQDSAGNTYKVLVGT